MAASSYVSVHVHGDPEITHQVHRDNKSSQARFGMVQFGPIGHGQVQIYVYSPEHADVIAEIFARVADEIRGRGEVDGNDNA